MITYNTFRNFFNKIDNGKEIEVILNNNESLLIVKHDNYLTYGYFSDSNVIKYKDLDDCPLKSKWNNIKDITIDFAFSLINDKDDILKVYNFKL